MSKSTYSVFLRWNPEGSSHSAYGKGYINYLCEIKASNLAEAKKEAREYQDDMDLGFLELLMTKGSIRSTFEQDGMFDVGCVIGRSSSIYHYPSRTKPTRRWTILARKGEVAYGEVVG
jgi:hypothetical protein